MEFATTDRAVEFSSNPTFQRWEDSLIALGDGGFSSGAGLGGKVLLCRKKQSIYTQGEPASTLFYIQEGGVRLTTRTKHQAAAVAAILGVLQLLRKKNKASNSLVAYLLARVKNYRDHVRNS